MYRAFKSIISSSVFLSLSLLPALSIAAENDGNGQNVDQRRGNADQIQNDRSGQQDMMMRGNPGENYSQQGWRGDQGTNYAQQGWRGDQNATYGQQDWRGDQGANYGYQNWRSDQQGPTYVQQGWRGDQGAAYGQQGWNTGGSHYSYGQPLEVYSGVVGSDHYAGGYSSNPSYQYHGSNADFNHNGVIESGERNYSYSPGFHRVRGRYSKSASSYPTYSNYSYSSPSYSSPSYGYSQGGYSNYPYSQSYQDDRGMGTGVYFNVR